MTTTTSSISEVVRVYYSRDIEHRAQPVMRFNQFAVTKTEFGVQAGNEVCFTTLNNLRRGKKITEGDNLPESPMSAGEYKLKVYIYGNSIIISHQLLFAAMIDTLSEAAILLGMDYAIVTDIMLRNAVHSTANEILANIADDSAPATSINDVVKGFTTTMIESATEFLAENNTPLFDNEYYIGIISPRQYSQIKKDSRWRSAQEYAGSVAIFKGEVGEFDNCRFIQTTVSPQGNVFEGDDNNDSAPGYDGFLDAANNGLDADHSTDGVDHSTQDLEGDLHAGIIFGDRAYAFGIGNPVELRDDGVTNFGLKHGLGYVAIQEAGLLEDGANAVRVISGR